MNNKLKTIFLKGAVVLAAGGLQADELKSDEKKAKDVDIVRSVRCAEYNDSLNAAQAIGRTKWTRRCVGTKDTLGLYQRDENGVLTESVILADGTIGYPIIGRADPKEEGSIYIWWGAPKDEKASCAGAEGYRVAGYCRAGCFEGDQLVLFAEGEMPIGAKIASEQARVVALDKSSSLEHLDFLTVPMTQIVRDLKSKVQEMIEIETDRGIKIKVTNNHPMLMSTGEMKSAKGVSVGEKLIFNNGQLDEIISVKPYRMFGKVYNIEIPSKEKLNHVVVSQGYLTGAIYFQNQPAEELNRKLLRSSEFLDVLFNKGEK